MTWRSSFDRGDDPSNAADYPCNTCCNSPISCIGRRGDNNCDRCETRRHRAENCCKDIIGSRTHFRNPSSLILFVREADSGHNGCSLLQCQKRSIPKNQKRHQLSWKMPEPAPHAVLVGTARLTGQDTCSVSGVRGWGDPEWSSWTSQKASSSVWPSRAECSSAEQSSPSG